MKNKFANLTASTFMIFTQNNKPAEVKALNFGPTHNPCPSDPTVYEASTGLAG